MKEIESEEQHRVWFYHQLEIITNKLETLPLSDTVSSSLCNSFLIPLPITFLSNKLEMLPLSDTVSSLGNTFSYLLLIEQFCVY